MNSQQASAPDRRGTAALVFAHRIIYQSFQPLLSPRSPFGKGNQEQGSDSKEDVSYRLGRYEIIQKPSGQMWWKTPSGHTGLRVGKSILAGDILFMEVGETEEQGNLKHAFLEHLNQLPEWRTAKYYCASCALYDCKTGKNQAREEGGGRPSEAPRASPSGIFTPPAITVIIKCKTRNLEVDPSPAPSLS
jgi:hypothetical protein